MPSLAEYWHMGGMPIRLRSTMSRSLMGSNRWVMVRFLVKERSIEFEDWGRVQWCRALRKHRETISGPFCRYQSMLSVQGTRILTLRLIKGCSYFPSAEIEMSAPASGLVLRNVRESRSIST